MRLLECVCVCSINSPTAQPERSRSQFSGSMSRGGAVRLCRVFFVEPLENGRVCGMRPTERDTASSGFDLNRFGVADSLRSVDIALRHRLANANVGDIFMSLLYERLYLHAGFLMLTVGNPPIYKRTHTHTHTHAIIMVGRVHRDNNGYDDGRRSRVAFMESARAQIASDRCEHRRHRHTDMRIPPSCAYACICSI